jgi:putative DNA primase/helicase
MAMIRTPIRERTRGRWLSILPVLGISSEFLTGKNGPCPMCGGKDRWRFLNTNGDGTWICNNCGSDAGTGLVMKFLGLPFREAALRIEEVLSEVQPVLARPTGPSRMRSAPDSIWNCAGPVRRGDPVDLWLRSRGVGLDLYPRTLRTTRLYNSGGWHPAMVALVEGPDGRTTIHRTFLTRDGRKASVPKPRMLAPGPFPHGGAVRLMPAGSILGVAEGIESGLAAAVRFRVPTWSAICAGMLERFEPPFGIEKLIIFGDNDPNGVGQRAAYTLAARLAGRQLVVAVRIPDAFKDWNDALLAGVSR